MRWILPAIVAICCALPAVATDVAILDAPINPIDKRNDYTNQLLSAILKKTEKKYGAFKIEYAPAYMHRERLLREMESGQLVNITAKATQPEWEEKLQAIYIPVDKGITEYRASLIRRQSQDVFSAADTLDKLRDRPLGVGTGWSSLPVFQANGFSAVPAQDYEGLFRMLLIGRFEHFPRAISEAFVEYDDRKAAYPELAVEDSFLIYFPLPKYFFISPKAPRLAQRVEEGFRILLRDGSFERIFLAYHQRLIERTNFCARRIFKLKNPYLSSHTPLDKDEYWFDPQRYKKLCPR